jgi:NAD(P)-dependent dehydrogenase (short-subunit alcohol dehydrogenase family)
VREVGFGHLTKVITIECDLQSFESVRAAAAALNDYCIPYGGLDALVCNAGVMGVPDSRTEDGYEVQMQTNHLSHFLLTALCMPSLERAGVGRGEARIVQVRTIPSSLCLPSTKRDPVQHSSGARSKKMATDGVGHLKAEFFEKSAAGTLGGDAIPACFNRYHQTKLANTVFAMTLHEKLKSTKYVCFKQQQQLSVTTLCAWLD